MRQPNRATRVTVFIPVYDPHPAYFREAVASVLAQSYQDWTLLVVEDPSRASAADVLKQFADPRIRHVRNESRTGLLRQRNRGFEETSTEYVALLDADDVAEPHRLERQVAFLDSNPEVGVVGSHVTIIDPDGKRVGVRRYPLDHGCIVTAMRRYNAVAQPSVMLRRAPMVRQGGYQMEGPAEDYELWSRVAKAGVKLANVDEALTRYRIHPGASKQTQMRQTIRNSLEVKRRHWGAEMNLGDRVRTWGERALLPLPAWFVLFVFRRLSYSRE